MNINKKVYSFDASITGRIPRSVFNRKSGLKTTFNAGDLVPIFIDEVLPGDTFSMEIGSVVRQSTLIKPVMDNAYLDIHFYFVPDRIVDRKFKNVMGENTDTKWVSKKTYSIPQVKAPEGGWNVGSLADYFGIPTGVSNLSVNAYPFRMYCKIWNDYYRDQNLQDPTFFADDSVDIQGTNGKDPLQDVVKGGCVLKAGKYHDYFTSCLPAPQKGEPVRLSMTGDAPVYTGSNTGIPFDSQTALSWYATGYSTGFGSRYIGIDVNGQPPSKSVSSDSYLSQSSSSTTNLDVNTKVVPANLWAKTSGISMATISELRFAFQLQRMYERDARGGSRYPELILSHFGVVSPDARQQRPEFLGGTHRPINVNQVLQTSSTDSVTPQGNVSGFSLNAADDHYFTKSFTEHGFVIGLAVVRTEHTYQQGLERFWSRRDRDDFYWPVFANISEQPVYNKEIYAQGTKADDEVFGYNEAWADYRYKPSKVTGYFRSTAKGSLDYWHYADKYEKQPILSADWIQETPLNIDRTIVLKHTVTPQFIADFAFHNKAIRPMPTYSIPGMLDRN